MSIASDSCWPINNAIQDYPSKYWFDNLDYLNTSTKDSKCSMQILLVGKRSVCTSNYMYM